MLSSLSDGQRLVGIKQCTKAVNDGMAQTAFVAEGVAPNISEPFLRLCDKKQVPVIMVSTKKELGRLCQIDVEASVAVVVK